jgi:hypothetical protein
MVFCFLWPPKKRNRETVEMAFSYETSVQKSRCESDASRAEIVR